MQRKTEMTMTSTETDAPADPGRRGALRGAAQVGLSALAASVATACVAGGPPAGAQDPGPTDPALTAAGMLGKTLRVIRPGDAVTMDYSEDRVNVELGPDGRIVRVFIG